MVTLLHQVNPAADCNYPLAYSTVKTFHALLTNVLNNRDQYYTATDEHILHAWDKAFELVHQLFFATDNNSSHENNIAAAAIRQQNFTILAQDALQSQSSFVPKFSKRRLGLVGNKNNAGNGKEEEESLSAAGHLEKLLMPLDLEQEEQTAGEALNIGAVMQKDLLKSDIVLDLMEQTLKKQ